MKSTKQNTKMMGEYYGGLRYVLGLDVDAAYIPRDIGVIGDSCFDWSIG